MIYAISWWDNYNKSWWEIGTITCNWFKRLLSIQPLPLRNVTYVTFCLLIKNYYSDNRLDYFSTYGGIYYFQQCL